MTDLMMTVGYTKNSSANPASGLTLAEIALYLTAVNRSTGATTVIWDGTQNPNFEIDNTGFYGKIYSGADLDTYNYFGGGLYSGATVLDDLWVVGAVGLNNIPIGTAVEFTYTVTNSITGNPVEGVDVWITTDLAGNNVIWKGNTDSFGAARDDFDNLPRLDPGTYYFWKQQAGFIDNDNPDTEVVS